MPFLAPLAAPVAGAAASFGAGKLLNHWFGGGHTVNTPQMPGDIGGLRGDLISWLRGSGMTPNTGGGQPYGGVNQQGGLGPTFAGGRGAPATDTGGMAMPVLKAPTSAGTPGTNGVTAGGLPPGLLAALTGSNGVAGTSDFGGGSPGSGGAPVGSAGAQDPFAGMYYHPQGFNPATAEAGQIADTPQISPTTVGPAGSANFSPASAGAASNYNQFLDPAFGQILAKFGNSGSGGFLDGYSAPQASQVGPVAQSGSVADMLKNVSDIVNGQGGYFKDNVLNAYNPLFQQQRDLALAQAKESAGNLTGSGFANTLGNSINRTVVDQGAQLSNILTQLAGMEQQRQATGAGLEQSRNFQNQNVDLQRGITNATLGTQASVAGSNALASLVGGRNNGLADFGTTLANLASNQANRTDLMNQYNAGQQNTVGTQQAIANAHEQTQQAIAQGQITASQAQTYFNAVAQRNIQQASNNQTANQFNAGQYNAVNTFNTGQANDASRSNAGNFLQTLLSMANGGVTAGSLAYQPGASDSLSQILPWLVRLFSSGSGSGGTPDQGTGGEVPAYPATVPQGG